MRREKQEKRERKKQAFFLSALSLCERRRTSEPDFFFCRFLLSNHKPSQSPLFPFFLRQGRQTGLAPACVACRRSPSSSPPQAARRKKTMAARAASCGGLASSSSSPSSSAASSAPSLSTSARLAPLPRCAPRRSSLAPRALAMPSRISGRGLPTKKAIAAPKSSKIANTVVVNATAAAEAESIAATAGAFPRGGHWEVRVVFSFKCWMPAIGCCCPCGLLECI